MKLHTPSNENRYSAIHYESEFARKFTLAVSNSILSDPWVEMDGCTLDFVKSKSIIKSLKILKISLKIQAWIHKIHSSNRCTTHLQRSEVFCCVSQSKKKKITENTTLSFEFLVLCCVSGHFQTHTVIVFHSNSNLLWSVIWFCGAL